MECGARGHTGDLPGDRRRLIASILAGIAAGLLCGLAQAQETKTLSWTPPTERVDGTALSAGDLSAHRVLCEPGIDELVPMPATSYVVSPPAESCVVRAIDRDGLESVDSTRVFPEWAPDPPPEAPGPPTDVRVAVVELPPATGPPGGGGVMADIGNTAFDGTSERNLENNAFGVAITMPEDGVAVSVTARLRESFQANIHNVRAGIYSADGSTLIDSSDQYQDIGTSIENKVFSGFTATLEEGVSYLVVIMTGGGGGSLFVSHGTATDAGRLQEGVNWSTGDLPASISVTTNNERYDLYLTYEPAASGSTVEASLSTPAAALAANVGVARTVSAALSVPAATLAGASEVERQAAADLELAAVQLNATTGAIREASAALGIAPLELAASGSVERNASVALVVPQPTLEANAGAGRSVSAALEIAAPELLSDVMIERSVSAALDIPAATLAANLGADKTVAASLITPSPALSSQVSVVRLASGELALAVPVLAGSAIGEELTVSVSLQTPAPVLDMDAMISRTASGALEIALPVLDGEVSRETTAEAVLIVRAPEMAAQAAIERFVSGELTIAELELAAQAFQGAIQPVIGLRATVRQVGRMASVTQIGRKATIRGH